MTEIQIKISPHLCERIDSLASLCDILRMRERLCICLLDSILQNYPLAYKDILRPYCDCRLMKNTGSVCFGENLLIDAKDEDRLAECVKKGIMLFEQSGINVQELCTVKVGGRYISEPWCSSLSDERANELFSAAHSMNDIPENRKAAKNIAELRENDIMIKLTVEHYADKMKPYQLREMSKQCLAQSEICEKHIIKHGGALIYAPGAYSISVLPEEEWDFMRKMSEELLQKVNGIDGVKNVRVHIERCCDSGKKLLHEFG